MAGACKAGRSAGAAGDTGESLLHQGAVHPAQEAHLHEHQRLLHRRDTSGDKLGAVTVNSHS